MKTTVTKIIFSLIFLVVMGYSFAQAPQAFNYQAVARDISGNVLPNQLLGIRVSLHMGTATGTVVYSETFTPTTNPYGLFTLSIGIGTSVSGQFDTIAWGKNQYYMQVEMDPAGGVTYTDMGTSQLLSVPYAMYAERTKALPPGTSGQTLAHDASGWVASDFLVNTGVRIGIGTTTPGFLCEMKSSQSYLHINSTGTFGGILLNRPDTNSYMRLMYRTDDSNKWYVGLLGAKDGYSVSRANSDDGTFHINHNNGYVGIGTIAPTNIFEVVTGTSGSKFRVGSVTYGSGFGQDFNSSNASYFLANGGSYWHFCYAATPADAYTRIVSIDGGGNVFRPSANNTVSLGNSGYKWTAVWAVNGTIQTSDLRYKTDIADIPYGLKEVLKLRPVSYSWKNEKLNTGTGKNLGFIAQEMETLVPDVVVHTQIEIDKETDQPGSEYPDAYGVKYSELIPVLVKAIQEQQAQIELLKQEIKTLKEK
ncbi:MAG TPA: tail fiber domain-containing protein [Bacteroidales bacterium]|nr:tail fiber domain-containing protein [Bacteroidales bacterium]